VHNPGMISGADIKATRQALAESQTQFAERFGVDQATIHRWEARGLTGRGPSKLIEEAIRGLRNGPVGPSYEDPPFSCPPD